MKPFKFIFLIVLLNSTISCIGEDIVDDFVEPSLKINNPLSSLAVGETYQFEATYLNNVGLEEKVELTWSSSDESVISIDTSSGLAIGVSNGDAVISVATKDKTLVSSIESPLMITGETVEQNQARSGTIVTTSSYLLTGDFSIEETASNVLRLSILENYKASTALPGLYIYLSNNPNTINGALEIGPVSVFNGAHSYDISDVTLNQYNYILYWCKPFSVKVGEGLIN